MTPKPREPEQQDRMMQLQAALQRLGGVNDVRHLFCNVLHYDYENGIVPTTAWPDAAKQCLAPGVAPQIIADQNGFKVIYLQLATDNLRKSSERQLVQRLIKDNPGMRGLVVVSDIDQKHWNLVNVKFDRDGKNRDQILLRRMRVGPGQPVRTAVERLSQVDVEILGEDVTAADLQNKHDAAFDVEAVTKRFFNDVANWYFWALNHVEFPKDAPKEDDGHDHVSLIRLITRLIFCWFLREKGLLPDTLFDRRQLNDILTGFAPDKARNKDSVFYRAILQNLFFATLSTETDKRKWVTDEQNFMAHSLYRFKDCFQKPATALNLFKSIPFLNGGLFECLDRDLGEGKKPRYIRIDGFSRRSDSQPVVPDFLFFGPEREIDLSAEYGDRCFRNVRVRGLIDTLRHYNFTIEENTPIEEEVALDPELCGKVFENLLAAYNPETGTTARKQSGSFYTPREIVNYMVDEALIASLATKLEAAIPTAKDVEPRLRHLFTYNDELHQFDKKEVKALIAAIDTLKTLDPAVGSGAFPMGLLHKLVFILGKLDPRNEQWKERQIARVRDAIKVAEKIEDDTVRSRTVEDLEVQIANVEESFARNELDYGRKLYLIENCIYGVDIQPIAVQIAKMRFFISLIVDQKIDDELPNRGVRPLPNLETKFVAANTLIGIDRPTQQLLRNREIDEKEAELRKVRERHFLARTPKQKAKCRDDDASLRGKIANMLKDDGWDTDTARRLASWDPYNQNASADFFDLEWMFGLTNGFEVVIANPPYISHDKICKEEKAFYKKHYETYEPFADIYCYFIEQSANFLNHRGIACFITSNSYIKADYGRPLRELIGAKHHPILIVNIEDTQVFEAAIVNTAILVYRHGPSNKGNTLVTNRPLESASLSEHLSVHGQIIPSEYLNSRYWVLESTKVLAAKAKIEHKHATLESIGTKIRLGIATGHNDAFVIDNTTRKSLIHDDAKCAKIIKPVLRGREIGRYYHQIPSSHLLLVKNGVNVPQDYPSVFAHFSKYGSAFRRRGAQGQQWWNLRACAFYDDFEKDRIVWIELSDNSRFSLCEAGVYLLNTAYFILPPESVDARALLAILNSKTILFYFRLIAQTSGMGTTRWFKEYVSVFPIPELRPNAQARLVKIVDRILAEKQKNPNADTNVLEGEIDEQVYLIYCLTAEEIKIVEEATA